MVSKYLQFTLQNTHPVSMQGELSKGKESIVVRRQTIKLLPAFVSGVTVLFGEPLYPQITKELPYAHTLFATAGSCSREGLTHQLPERDGNYALDLACCSTCTGEEPPPTSCLWCNQLPSSSGAAIQNSLDCSWLPKCLENYTKLN